MTETSRLHDSPFASSSALYEHRVLQFSIGKQTNRRPNAKRPTRRDEHVVVDDGLIHLKSADDDDCFHRLPYASLIASLLCILGVVLFAIMMSWAFNATAEQTRRTLRIDDWPWLDKVQVVFIVLATIMSFFALFFLCIGFTATGATRETMYKDASARCGGKVACVIAMIFDILLVIAWLFITSIVSMLCVAYFFFDRLCLHLPAYSEADCIDLHVFWPLVASFANSSFRVCGGDAQQFCALSSTAFSWYVIGWVGSVLILLGLLLFFGIHASNYAHIGNASKYIELNHVERYDPQPTRGRRYEPSHQTWMNSNYS
ncbi:unnamed protein product [Caenorhabditis bovis]|uniref:Uncharacterized protein n=1 Tax=Caenorhabditis bovis TaxID=2654633 RepID=A0A8S1F5L4_9PELO|nr:unnamed protein product [Caenorhabditis bovis]